MEPTVTEAIAAKPAVPLNASPLQLISVAGLSAAADWLFYDRPVGISAALFLIAVLAVSAAANRKANTNELLPALVVFGASVIPLIYSFTPLSFLFAIAGTALSVQMIANPRASWAALIEHASKLFPDMIWRAISDVPKIFHELSHAKDGALIKSAVGWIVPAILGIVFISLFASANPVIDDWFAAIHWKSFLQQLSAPRILFWLLVVAIVWPLVFLRNRADPVATAPKAKAAAFSESSDLFGKTAILRSLALFNLLFVVQTGLDATYLWGGLQLPHDMSYATYAHRGAYPLIVTALLAAAFVLVATRPGSDAERSPLIRNLVYLWIAQNILLVVSSAMRLSLYIDVYSLTYWRVAAFIWMLLVAIGLVLIVTRLVLRRSSNWLVASNVISLTAVLYVCCFINFPLLIANYNVTHSRELSGKGLPLDLHYLVSLGPQAIPALDRYAQIRKDVPQLAVRAAEDLVVEHRLRMEDWRAWTYQDWQLARYLRARKTATTTGG